MPKKKSKDKGITNFFINKFIQGWINKLRKENQLMKWLDGKKTYIVMAITAILGGIGALNQAGLTQIQVPDMVFTILAALGWYTRSIVKPK